MQKLKSALKSFFGKSKQPPNPIQWKYTAKKTSFNTYEVHITAFIVFSWRLYSQESALEGPLPIIIQFEENTFVILKGDIKETGTLKEEYNKIYKIITHFYTTFVNFTQEVIAFAPPEILKGKIIYTACTDKECLNLKEIELQIELN